MSDSPATNPDQAPTRDEMWSALFAQMVIQQSNLAMMLMGKVPHPQTGQSAQDLEGARMFIDQLEMLQAKTKGNLTPDEEKLLKQSLLALQMMFVEAIESSAAAPSGPAQKPSTPPGPAAEGKAPDDKAPLDSGAADAESRKKFSKKY